MPDKPIESEILSEAEGAHRTSREILLLMQAPADDPILTILAALARIEDQQRTILTRLEILDRKLPDRAAPPARSPG